MTTNVHLDGADEARRKLRSFSTDANRALRAKAREIVDDTVPEIKSAARRSSGQSRLVADTIRSKSDRFPSIVAGGSKRLATRSRSGKKRPRGRDVVFGAEFGGRRRPTTQQFREHRGKRGYFLWPTIRANEDRIGKQWLEAVDQLAEEFES